MLFRGAEVMLAAAADMAVPLTRHDASFDFNALGFISTIARAAEEVMTLRSFKGPTQ
jgi:hypothetical protein